MPDGWAVLRPDGRFIDIFADKASADYVARNQQRIERGTVRVRPMVFDDKPDPLGEALNSGDESYRP